MGTGQRVVGLVCQDVVDHRFCASRTARRSQDQGLSQTAVAAVLGAWAVDQSVGFQAGQREIGLIKAPLYPVVQLRALGAIRAPAGLGQGRPLPQQADHRDNEAPAHDAPGVGPLKCARSARPSRQAVSSWLACAVTSAPSSSCSARTP